MVILVVVAVPAVPLILADVHGLTIVGMEWPDYGPPKTMLPVCESWLRAITTSQGECFLAGRFETGPYLVVAPVNIRPPLSDTRAKLATKAQEELQRPS